MADEIRLTSEDIMPLKKNRKKIIIISVAAAAVIILGVSGFFIWKKYSDKQKQLNETQQQLENLKKESENSAVQNPATQAEVPATTENPGTIIEEDEYIGWKTYTNSEVGYELRYPADWSVKETNAFSELMDKEVKYIAISNAGKKYFVYWGLKNKNDEFGISDRSGVGAGDFIQEGDVTVLGTQTAVKKLVYKGKIKEYFFPGSGSGKTADGNYLFGASLSGGSSVSYDSLDMTSIPEVSLAKKILQSVKIIPRTISSSGCALTLTSADNLNMKDWKTFHNSKYDYSFKYPKEWTYDKVSDKLINFKNGPDGEVFSWRSEEMTALGFEGWDLDTTKNLKVACQSAKSTYLEQGDERMIFTQFKYGGKNHMTNFGYKYVGASISSDLIEEYDMILKSIVFE